MKTINCDVCGEIIENHLINGIAVTFNFGETWEIRHRFFTPEACDSRERPRGRWLPMDEFLSMPKSKQKRTSRS